jgi:hypothetical protein
MIRASEAMRGLFVIALVMVAIALVSCSSPTQGPEGSPPPGGSTGVGTGVIGPVNAPSDSDQGYIRLPTNAAPPADAYEGPAEGGDEAEATAEDSSNEGSSEGSGGEQSEQSEQSGGEGSSNAAGSGDNG